MAKDDDILDEARDLFRQCEEREADNRDEALDDLEFARLARQWRPEDEEQRAAEGRPCLTINRMPAFIRQVVNDARQNAPSIAVRAVDDAADPATVGRYQIRKETLQDLQRALGLPMTQVFDAALQDRLANKLFEWRGLNEYFGGKISAQKFQDRLKDEWAVIPEFGQQGKLSTGQVQDAISRFPRYGD